jgi:hypothetical protein
VVEKPQEVTAVLFAAEYERRLRPRTDGKADQEAPTKSTAETLVHHSSHQGSQLKYDRKTPLRGSYAVILDYGLITPFLLKQRIE